MQQEWSRLWLPPERLPLSQWAEKNVTLSSEYAARTGPIQLYGFQREPLDCFTDPRVETLVLMCSTQMLKTILIQLGLAYAIVEQPGPALVLQPKDGDAKAFSTERLSPMIRDCEALRSLVSESKGRSSNTILQKSFPGGSLALAGAIAPGNMARRSIRYLFCDEIDKYPASAGAEGDPIDLARERTATFGSRRKIALCCSPTVAGLSRIGKAYDSSDQRRPWVPCPACGEFQVLKWGQVVFQPEPHYGCAHCGAWWNDVQRRAACEKVVWRAEKPFRGTAGFWISHLYSPWKTLSEMVSKWLETEGDRQRRKVFINTTLAELWVEEGETPDHEVLFGRREPYPAGDEAVVPKRGMFLTAAVDVQDSPPRLECEVVAWGRERENWSIGYWTIQSFAENGQPLPVTSPELWTKLDELLQRTFRHENGQRIPIMVMAIDTGSRPKPVYEFAKKHAQPVQSASGLRVVAPRTVVAIKGTDNAFQVIASVSKEDAARKRQNVRIVGIGTHCVKQETYDLLRHVRPRSDGGAMPGCFHFPESYKKHYFEGLCSEQRIVRDGTGDVVWEKRPNVRNEPLDLKVYNRGAAAVFGIDRMTDMHWKKLETDLAPLITSADQRPEIQAKVQPAGPRPTRPVRFRFDA